MNGVTAIYMRVSTGDQRLDSQERELQNYCAHRGWARISIYTDTSSGAKAIRPGLDSLLADMRSRTITRLVCYKLDRLGRSLTHLASIFGEMSQLGIPLICTSQGIDTSVENPVGRLQLGVLMAVAEFERGIIRDRVNAGLAAAKAKGVTLGRPATLRLRRSEVQALQVSGLGVRAIARELKMPVSSVHSLLSPDTKLSNDRGKVLTLPPDI